MSEKLNNNNEQMPDESTTEATEYPAFDPESAEEARRQAMDELKRMSDPSAINSEHGDYSFFKTNENGEPVVNYTKPRVSQVEIYKNGKRVEDDLSHNHAFFGKPWRIPGSEEVPTPPEELIPEPTQTPEPTPPTPPTSDIES